MPGLHFHKLDLHIHTPASKCYLQKDHTPEQFVQAALDKGLDGIAITDHNSAEWIEKIQVAAKDRGLVIFPGVEITMADGFHLIALFDISTIQADIENFLGAIDITPADYGQKDTICKKSIYDVVEKIHDRSGLAILAYIDQPKGAFVALTGVKENGNIYVPGPTARLFNEAKYDAVECTEGCYPKGFDSIHSITRMPPYYQASDNPDPIDPSRHSKEGIGNRYSWFKLDQIDLEGLRQCFADQEVRIQRMQEHREFASPHIIKMKVGPDGFLKDEEFIFHEGLNCLIGGKGVGKSLAVELLRFVLGQVSPDQSISSDVAGKLEKRLCRGNFVEVYYQIGDGTQYKILRTYDGQDRSGVVRSQYSCINIATNQPYEGDLNQIMPVLAYSQTEVIKIAEDKNAQLQLIDRFIDTSQYEREINAIREQLRINDGLLVDSIIARDKLAGLEIDIKTCIERIETINRALDNPVFNAMKQVEDQKRAFEKKINEIETLDREVRAWINKLVGYKPEPLPNQFTNIALMEQAQEETDGVFKAVNSQLRALNPILENARQKVEEYLDSWMPEFQKVEEAYNQALQKLGGGREQKAAERKNLLAELQGLEDKAKQYRSKDEMLPDLVKQRNELLDLLEQAYFKFFEARKIKYDQLTNLSDGKLQLNLYHSTNRQNFEVQLMDLLKGGMAAPTPSERRQIAQNIMPRRFIQLVLDRNIPHLANEAGISERTAEKVIEKLWSHDDFREVLAIQHGCFPADVPSIRFRKGPEQYDELNELSVGQKCTALLIIALCDGNMPVIIDQPEDALDIVSVWEDIAKKLRRGKISRQFILTTHNSSVAVASDSDQFIVLTAGAIRGRVDKTGAIDGKEVRQLVIKHLEGGDEPYKLRSRKYNIH